MENKEGIEKLLEKLQEKDNFYKIFNTTDYKLSINNEIGENWYELDIVGFTKNSFDLNISVGYIRDGNYLKIKSEMFKNNDIISKQYLIQSEKDRYVKLQNRKNILSKRIKN